jgi:hypothetical protein
MGGPEVPLGTSRPLHGANQKRIYPPRHGTAQEILAAAAATVETPPQYPAAATAT